MRLLRLIPLMVSIISCSKASTSPTSDADSTLIVKTMLKGEWYLDSMIEKRVIMCGSAPCVFINPDGSYKPDTTITIRKDPAGYWMFSENEFTKEFTWDAKETMIYSIIGNADGIQPLGRNPYKIIFLKNKTLITTVFNVGPKSNDQQPYVYSTYYFTKQ